MPKISDAGLNLIREFEGDELRSYPDPGTGGDPWTIGYGHTANVHPGQAITEQQAVDFLRQDVGDAERCVQSAVTRDATPNQFAAMVSLAYNIGCDAFKASSVLRYFNAGNMPQAADSFRMWTYGGGVQLPGLIRRRATERALFLESD